MKIDENDVVIQKLMQPREHVAKVSIWADLTIDDIDKINESLNAEHVKQILADVFNLTDYKTDMRNAILIDLYYYTLKFADDNKFTKEQTSAFFSIVKRTHEVCIETPFGNVQQTFAYFKDMVLCHAVNRPPRSIELFSAAEVRTITEYVINTYFRHFKMYKYAFTPMVRLDLAFSYVGMPSSPPPSNAPSEIAEEEEKEEEAAAEGEQVQEATPEPVADESPARKELRAMIENFLSNEVEKIKTSVDEQIKNSEAAMNKKLEQVEEASVTGRRSRGSPKGKKGK